MTQTYLTHNHSFSKQKKLGRPFKYPRILILFILFLKYAFRLPYRQTEGFVRALFKEMGIATQIPNFRTIHYRHSKEDFVIVLDSTGIKLTNRREWLSKKHGKKKRKGWIKLHVALDISSGKVVAMKVTDNRTHDSECAIGLIETARRKAEAVGCKVKEVIADTGIDSHEIFRYLGKRGIKPVIKVRKDAVITGNMARDKLVREMRRGRKRWKERNGYGRRWSVESFFSVFKRWFGEHVSSVKFENIVKEIMFKVMIVSMFLSGGVGMLVR